MRNAFLRTLHHILHQAHLGDALDRARARGDQVEPVEPVVTRAQVGEAFKRAGQTPRPGSSTGSLPKNSPSPASQPARHFLTSEEEDIMTAVWFIVVVLLVAIISWRLP